MSWQDLVKSKRFWAAIAAILVVVVRDKFPNLPFSEDQISQIVMVVAAWIVGDSLRGVGPAHNPTSTLLVVDNAKDGKDA